MGAVGWRWRRWENARLNATGELELNSQWLNASQCGSRDARLNFHSCHDIATILILEPLTPA
jgi:hypothetical protein